MAPYKSSVASWSSDNQNWFLKKDVVYTLFKAEIFTLAA